MNNIYYFIMVLSVFATTPKASGLIQLPSGFIKTDYEIYDLQNQMIKNFDWDKKIKNVYWIHRDFKVQSYRHLYPMMAASVLAERKDQQDLALSWLLKYECENQFSCRNYYDKLDYLTKSMGLTLSKKRLNQFLQIKENVNQKLKSMNEINSFCAVNSERQKALEWTYQNHCPWFKTSVPLKQETIQHEILKSTKQVILSSSRLVNFSISDDVNCEKPWLTQITCENQNGEIVENWMCETSFEQEKLEIKCAHKK